METYLDLPELHPTQQELFDDPSRFKIAMMGRQWGKSTVAIQECVYTLLGQRNPNIEGKPENIFYITPFLNLARKFYGDILAVLDSIPDFVTKQNLTTLRIELKNGAYIQLYGADNPNNMRGMNDFSLAIIDEAAFMDFTTLWEKVIQPVIRRKKGRVYVISTPDGTNAFYKLWLKASAGTMKDWKSFKRTSYESYYPKEELDEVKATCESIVGFEQEYLVMVTSSQSNPFKYDDIQKGIIPKLSGEKTVAYGVDISNGKNDSTVVIGLDSNANMSYYNSWKIQNNYAEQVDRINELPKGVLKVIDCTGAGVAVSEALINKGHYVHEYTFTNKSKGTLIYKLIGAVERNRVRYIQSVANEMQIYQMTFSETSDVVKFGNQKGVGNNDDEVTSLALAFFGLTEYISVGSNWKGFSTC